MATKRTRRRLIIGGCLTVILLWLLACGWLLRSADRDAHDGLDSMEDFSSLATDDVPAFIDSIGGQSGDAEDDDAAARLHDAAKSFSSAHDSASSPLLLPLKVLPVIGRQIRSVDKLSGAAATTTESAASAFDSLSAILDAPSDGPTGRVDTTAQVQEVLTTLQDDIDDLDLGPSEALVGPLARAHDRFATEYATVLTTLDDAVVGVTGVRDFLEGPNHYLVLAANNAEMRAGSGMFLQIGSMDVANGEFDLGEFEAAADLKLEQPGATLDPDLAKVWAPLEPTQDWRNVNVTPRFDESARMASEMWASLGRGDVDGVMAIDVVGVKHLLELVGPVEIEGADGPVTISADNVEHELLLQQYLDNEDLSDEVQGERRAQLGRVAAAVFESFNQRPVSATQLLQVLQQSGDGRHLLLWSSKPAQQAAWEALGAAGTMSGDDLLVSILNRGGNKLDPFVNTSSVMTSTTSGDTRHVSVQVSMQNTVPTGLPLYVEGPYPGTPVAAGDYVALLSMSVPGTATNPKVTGAELASSTNDGPNKVVIASLVVPRDTTGVITVEFDLPTAVEEVDVLPTARVPAMAWTAGADQWKDNRPHTVDLDSLE